MKQNVGIMMFFWLHWTKFIAVPEVLWIVLFATSAAALETATLLPKDTRHRSTQPGQIDRKEILSELSAISDGYEIPTHHHHVIERVSDLESYHVEKNISLDLVESSHIDEEHTDPMSQPGGTNLDSRVKKISNISDDEVFGTENSKNPISSSSYRSLENNGSIPYGPILNFDSNSNIVRDLMHAYPVIEKTNQNSNKSKLTIKNGSVFVEEAKGSENLTRNKDFKTKQNDTKKLYKDRLQINDDHSRGISKKYGDNENKSEIIDDKMKSDIKCSVYSGESSSDIEVGRRMCIEPSNNGTIPINKIDKTASAVSSVNAPSVQKFQGLESEDELKNRPDFSNFNLGASGSYQNSNDSTFARSKSKVNLETKTSSKDIISQLTTKGLDDSKKKMKIKSKTPPHQLLEDGNYNDTENSSVINSNDSYLMNDQPNVPSATTTDEDKVSSPSTDNLDDSSEFIHHDNETLLFANANSSAIETSENSSSLASSNGRTMKAMSNKEVDQEQSYFENSDFIIIMGIVSTVIIISSLIGAASFMFYRHRYWNKPQTLSDKCSNADSSGYIDDSTLRENSEEMYSLDNDSFLNSLEAMTIQNYWTDNVKHTKL